MSLHGDLLQQANLLVNHEPRRPRQSSLRRAVSTAYYSLFHLFVDEAVRLLVPGGDRKRLRQALSRAFAHNDMKEVAQQFAKGDKGVSPKVVAALNGESLSVELISVATAFVDLQQARHEADYDTSKDFSKQECLDLVVRVEDAFKNWDKVRRRLPSDVFLISMLSQKHMRN